MTYRLDDHKLLLLKRLHERATPGTWKRSYDMPDDVIIDAAYRDSDHREPVADMMRPADQAHDDRSSANADFIVEAHAAVPALIEEIERQRRQIDQLQRANSELSRMVPHGLK